MKLTERFKNAVTAFKQTETHTATDDEFWRTLLPNAPKGALSEITYFTCLKTLSESVAKLPLKLYRQSEHGIEKARDLPLYNILKLRPNRNMTATTFWATVELLKHHRGNCYVYPYRKTPLSAPELMILDNNYLTVYADNAKIISDSGQIWYLYAEPTTGKIYKIPDSDMLHFKTSMSLDGITGMSVREVLRATIDGAYRGQNFVNKMYETGLTGKVGVEYTADLDEIHRKKLIKTIEAAANAENAINYIPIPWGIKLNPLNLKLTDAQFLEIKKYTALQIAGAFGIKPNQLNDYEKSSYANSEQQQQAFMIDTLLVNLKGIEEELTTKLLTEDQVRQGYFFKFNTDAILRASFAERMAGYHNARQDGWLSANDIRDKEDMTMIPEEEGGNAYLVNGNMIPITEAMKGGEEN